MVKDIDSIFGSFSAQITDLQGKIKSILSRNNIADEDIQGIKSDMNSLEAKILAIKVSSFQGFYWHFGFLTFWFSLTKCDRYNVIVILTNFRHFKLIGRHRDFLKFLKIFVFGR